MPDQPPAVPGHALVTREGESSVYAGCECGALLIEGTWTGADRDAVLDRFRVGAADAHRMHLRWGAPDA
jgi:hypothetical protein